MWKLKPEENEFQVTREGEFEYRTFRHGETYAKVPEEEAPRFEKVGAEKETPKKKRGGDEK